VTWHIEQSERRPRYALKERAVGSRARKNADAEKHPEQQACSVVGIDVARHRSVDLRGENAPLEKCFDLGKLFDDHSAPPSLLPGILEFWQIDPFYILILNLEDANFRLAAALSEFDVVDDRLK
jgi:hypothetical protein